MAVEVGVTYKPDVTMHSLQPEDRYLIVASDGVWELITSQVRSASALFSVQSLAWMASHNDLGLAKISL